MSPPPPTTQVFLELAGHILDVDPGSLTDAERETYLAVAEHVAKEQRFFHWELEFPEVWRGKDGRPKRSGGFDAVVGNPPWDALSPNTKEFFSNYESRFIELTKQEARALIAQLREDPAIDQAWLRYAASIMQQVHFVRRSTLYDWFAPGNLVPYHPFHPHLAGSARTPRQAQSPTLRGPQPAHRGPVPSATPRSG